MKPLPQFRHIVGLPNDRIAEQANDTAALQSMFDIEIPDTVLGFLKALPDCTLYYSFDTILKTGRIKAYGHFLTTNIGPELNSYSPFPVSIMGLVAHWRKAGLPSNTLPIMNHCGTTSWVFCRINGSHARVCKPKGDREFGENDRQWAVMCDSMDTFLDSLELYPRPMFPAFRAVGFGRVSELMRSWMLATVGPEWEAELSSQMKPKSRKGT